jgi:hypothetical protein
MTCRVTLTNPPPSASLRWRLVRGRHAYQRGVAQVLGNVATVRLHPRQLTRGRYSLRIAGLTTAVIVR